MLLKNTCKQAFTMFELIIVIALIAVIAAVIIPQATKYLGKAKESEINLKFIAIKQGLMDYNQLFGVYPTTREGLAALITNPRPNDDRYRKAADRWPFVKEDIIEYKGDKFEYFCPPQSKTFRYFELKYVGQKEDGSDSIIDGE